MCQKAIAIVSNFLGQFFLICIERITIVLDFMKNKYVFSCTKVIAIVLDLLKKRTYVHMHKNNSFCVRFCENKYVFTSTNIIAIWLFYFGKWLFIFMHKDNIDIAVVFFKKNMRSCGGISFGNSRAKK